MNNTVNIVSLNVPYPADYGGVIDIYCKIAALHRCGMKIILHCFEYGRPSARELEELCLEVHYYKRRTGILSNLSLLPYNVYSRRDPRLVDNLLRNDFPILFEGLHTCYYINDDRLRNRLKIFRECNIEHDYYYALARAESNPVRKLFYGVEALRFRRFQSKVSAAALILSVSAADAACLRKMFPGSRVEFMPCFHAAAGVSSTAGRSDFILYHGKLSVVENEKAALYLIRKIFSRLPEYRCVIAGMDPSARLRRAAAKHANITLIANPTVDEIARLIRTAHINLLVTFQATGLKLKLLNSLFSGRHVAVNTMMLAGSGLEALCHTADSPDEMTALCRRLMAQPFTEDALDLRRSLLLPGFSNEFQARKLIQMISDFELFRVSSFEFRVPFKTLKPLKPET